MSGLIGIGINTKQKHNLVEQIYNALVYMADLGEEGSGLCVAYGSSIKKHRELSTCDNQRLIYEMLSDQKWQVVIGHDKKALEEEIPVEAVGPIKIRPLKDSKYNIYVAFDGYFLGANLLKRSLEDSFRFRSADQGEIAGALFQEALEQTESLVEAGKHLEEVLKGRGYYSTIFLINNDKENKLVGIRSTRGVTPLCYGVHNGLVYIASESNGLDAAGVEFKDFVEPGQMLIVSADEFKKVQVSESKPAPCIFQAIYFGSPDAYFFKNDQDIFSLRKKLGQHLARLYPNVEVDAVTYVPDSGLGSAEGYAEARKLPLIATLKKNRHTKKTFNITEENRRKAEVSRKVNCIRTQVKGKKLWVNEDSIVRGSVLGQGTAYTLKEGGVKSSDFGISYGPIFFPCLIDLDSVKRRKRIASDLYILELKKINKEVTKKIAEKAGLEEKFCSVHYNDLKALEDTFGKNDFCRACIDGNYPVNEIYLPDWLKRKLEEFRKAEKPYFQS